MSKTLKEEIRECIANYPAPYELDDIIFLVEKSIKLFMQRAREERTESLGRAIIYWADLERLVKEATGDL